MLGLVVLGSLYLVSRQLDQVVDEFRSLMNLQGLLVFATALFFIKIFHELGHALTAFRKGLHVPVIGLAFIVLIPIFYTDTSQSWRLKSHRDRLQISAAGIGAELIIAGLATVLWVFVPAGDVRTFLFCLATTSWVMSLAINLNPLMRFDGYFLLADLLGMENLQNRSFSLARWKLREFLFGPGLPPPERFSPVLHRSLICFAFATWLYRLALFLAIAVLVYSFFIKLIGIFLFVVEIVWFVLRPVYLEMKEWWLMRRILFRTRRSMVSLLVLSGLIGALTWPLSTRVSIPAMVYVPGEILVFAPMSANLKELSVHEGQMVQKGELLGRLHSPQLDRLIELTQQRQHSLKARLARSLEDRTDTEQRQVLLKELSSVNDRLSALQHQMEDLQMRAKVAGKVVDLNPQMRAGNAVSNAGPLLRIVPQTELALSGLVVERERDRLAVGANGTFVPEHPWIEKSEIELREISKTPVNHLEFAELSTQFGGAVRTVTTATGDHVPLQSYFSLTMQLRELRQTELQNPIRGTVLLDAQPRSYGAMIVQQIGKVLIRESGF